MKDGMYGIDRKLLKFGTPLYMVIFYNKAWRIQKIYIGKRRYKSAPAYRQFAVTKYSKHEIVGGFAKVHSKVPVQMDDEWFRYIFLNKQQAEICRDKGNSTVIARLYKEIKTVLSIMGNPRMDTNIVQQFMKNYSYSEES